MSEPAERAIRFAAGDPAGPYSSVFRLWGIDGDKKPGGQGDIYFAVGNMGNVIKTSLQGLRVG